MGWGLDLESNSGMTNWVHMPVPSKAGDTWAARYFKLRFFTGSIDAWISEVHVWNGDTLVKQFTDLSYSGAYQTVQFDLGNRVAFTKGMSVSIKINAGVEPMSHRFIFDGAGAHFTQPTLP
jgi:hypothetical protein